MLAILIGLLIMLACSRCCSMVGIVRLRLTLLLCCCWSFGVVIMSLTAPNHSPKVVQLILTSGIGGVLGFASLCMLYYALRGGCKFVVVLRRISTVSGRMATAMRKSSVQSKVSAVSTVDHDAIHAEDDGQREHVDESQQDEYGMKSRQNHPSVTARVFPDPTISATNAVMMIGDSALNCVSDLMPTPSDPHLQLHRAVVSMPVASVRLGSPHSSSAAGSETQSVSEATLE